MALWEIINVAIRGVTGTVPNNAVKTADFDIFTKEEAEIFDNTVGIIDADYYGSDNEGHIFTKITCDAKSDKVLELAAGDAFMQAVFLPYGLTEDDDVADIRNGGFGSTD